MSTWRAPEANRPPEPAVLAERPMLQAWLDYHRQTLVMKCEGLTPDQLRTPAVEPSTLTLLGLVRHMTEVERSWFTRRAAGLPEDHEFTHRGRTLSLRWVYHHMIEEYARHNGHADLLRERLDGTTGD